MFLDGTRFQYANTGSSFPYTARNNDGHKVKTARANMSSID